MCGTWLHRMFSEKAQKGAERLVFLIHKKPTFYWTADAGMEKNIMELNSIPPMPSMPILW